MKKRLCKILIICFAVIFLLGGAFIWYISIYYHADKTAEAALISDKNVKISKIKDGYFFDGEGSDKALIFYPGAKVEYTAYAPLMKKLAEEKIDCFLIDMPCNLAFFGVNKASDIIENYEYEKWYIGGHSLGGAMAADYAASSDDLSGLILLGAFPTKKLPDKDFMLISIYGSSDKVLDRDEVEKNKRFWPEDSAEICIDGGNHAFYGNYGEQKGDGKATITRENQQNQVVEAITKQFQRKSE